MDKHLPNVEQALLDAEILLNGGLPDDYVPERFDDCDPSIESVPTHPEDGEDDVATLKLMYCGEFTMCECPPLEGEESWDVANAIKRAGVHITTLAAENDRLKALAGKDAFEQLQRLLLAAQTVNEAYRQSLRYMSLAARVEEIRSESSDALKQLIKELSSPDKNTNP